MELVTLKNKCKLHRNQNLLGEKETRTKWCPLCFQIGFGGREDFDGTEEFE
jgi:hypothetical protein